MRGVLRAVPVALVSSVLAFGLSSAGDPVAGPVAASAAVPLVRAAPTKVMAIGDSITAGADAAQGGYRTDLWQLLRADGRPVDFVGSMSSGSAALADKDNEGHGGWTIAMIQENVVGWLTTYQPDVVTLMIGTNDMHEDATSGAAPGRLSALLDTIAQTSPNTQTFVSSIPPINDELKDAHVNAFNATIPAMVATKSATGKKVTFVDTNPAFSNPFDMADALHPNYGSLSKAAGIWYGALTGQPLLRLEAEQTANATLTHVQTGRITSASGGGKARYIDFADSVVAFTFQVPVGGMYRIRARGANGIGTNCSHLVSANGGAQSPVVYPSYSWDLLAVAAVDVPLVAGQNTVRFSKGDCYTELDAIDVGPVPTA
ncbi:GDSL-type esterase/lipase family protein [Kribbella sp. NBC_01505]|uniref:GDSL-type esterase/lipase family protein n=1 Tax=Kribbella sp. NBC_01505 TaxID=2903580 RepID=UPI0038642AE7